MFPVGGLPGWSPADLAVPAPAGGLAFRLARFSCHIINFLPPSPPTPFPAGRGGFLVYFAGGSAPGTPVLNRLRHLQFLPSMSPAGACLLCCPPTPPLVVFFPHPPAPLPGGKGEPFFLYFAGGSAPGTPVLNRLRHLQSLPSRCPAQGACGCPQKRQEAVPYEQCRQPRRGGIGGEELRRLRWSSPPGQGEPMPRGASPRCVFHSGRDSKCRRGKPPLRFPQRQG